MFPSVDVIPKHGCHITVDTSFDIVFVFFCLRTIALLDVADYEPDSVIPLRPKSAIESIEFFPRVFFDNGPLPHLNDNDILVDLHG